MTSEKLEFMAIKDDVRVLKEKGDKVHLKNTFKTPLGIIASKYEKKKETLNEDLAKLPGGVTVLKTDGMLQMQ